MLLEVFGPLLCGLQGRSAHHRTGSTGLDCPVVANDVRISYQRSEVHILYVIRMRRPGL